MVEYFFTFSIKGSGEGIAGDALASISIVVWIGSGLGRLTSVNDVMSINDQYKGIG